mmetsp:Transcript_111673/g.197880  ORF Transcript_111673/g.197880 Transcript_111673/m.197880 type:complete len:337 (-) Transcript_111673:42-1052(-)
MAPPSCRQSFTLALLITTISTGAAIAESTDSSCLVDECAAKVVSPALLQVHQQRRTAVPVQKSGEASTAAVGQDAEHKHHTEKKQKAAGEKKHQGGKTAPKSQEDKGLRWVLREEEDERAAEQHAVEEEDAGKKHAGKKMHTGGESRHGHKRDKERKHHVQHQQDSNKTQGHQHRHRHQSSHHRQHHRVKDTAGKLHEQNSHTRKAAASGLKANASHHKRVAGASNVQANSSHHKRAAMVKPSNHTNPTGVSSKPKKEEDPYERLLDEDFQVNSKPKKDKTRGKKRIMAPSIHPASHKSHKGSKLKSGNNTRRARESGLDTKGRKSHAPHKSHASD